MQSRDRDKRDFRLGDWLVQPGLGRISNLTGEVQLEPRAMDLLVFLADNAGKRCQKRCQVRTFGLSLRARMESHR